MRKRSFHKTLGMGIVSLTLVLVLSGLFVSLPQPSGVQAASPEESVTPPVDSSPATDARPITIDRNHIKQVIYPTFGNPAILRCGDLLTVEFDPRDQDWSQPFPTLLNFTATVRTSNSDYPVTPSLLVEGFTIGFSAHWPEYAQASNPKALIYLVNVRIPADVPCDLYDLTLNARRSNGTWLTDSQPHALSLVTSFKDDYTFLQMTDIHVWGPEAQTLGTSIHEKNYRHPQYSDIDGYGAAYYHKAIDQVNLEKPDFCVFTGDYDFSQKWIYQQNYADFPAYRNTIWGGLIYEPYFEEDWFYQETLKLDVPVFMTIGNHDSYARYNLFNTKLEEDYAVSWRNLFGPQYFSFDYGPDAHFLALDSSDWTSSDRNLHWLIPNLILRPEKWQGQLLGGGDAFQAGWSQAREDAIDLSRLTGQLAWARDDLAAHQSAKTRIVLLHHDPWQTDGSGFMFDDASMFGIQLGGRGQGRLALIKLLREDKVALVLSGHEHFDHYGSIPWKAGGGEVKFVNTTCTEFNEAPNMLNPKWDKMWSWPGYRMVRVANGNVVNYYYELAPDSSGKPLPYSWPFYAETKVGVANDYAHLVTPAVETTWMPKPGTAENVTCQITNHLTGSPLLPGGAWSGDLPNATLEFPMPSLNGHYYYTVTGGSFVGNYDSLGHRVFQVATAVVHAPSESNPTYQQVSVNKSASPDLLAPTCSSFRINGGASSTAAPQVTLTNSAVDLGGSGLYQMRIANDDPTFSGAVWRPYSRISAWTLRLRTGFDTDFRTVYIQFRDAAMPGNESPIYSATINLLPAGSRFP